MSLYDGLGGFNAHTSSRMERAERAHKTNHMKFLNKPWTASVTGHPAGVPAKMPFSVSFLSWITELPKTLTDRPRFVPWSQGFFEVYLPFYFPERTPCLRSAVEFTVDFVVDSFVEAAGENPWEHPPQNLVFLGTFWPKSTQGKFRLDRFTSAKVVSTHQGRAGGPVQKIRIEMVTGLKACGKTAYGSVAAIGVSPEIWSNWNICALFAGLLGGRLPPSWCMRLGLG